MTAARAFAPGSIGNVGPGFDVLGLAVEGIGDSVSVELTEGPSRIETISGRDAELVPRDPARNSAAIAAMAMLRMKGIERNVIVSIEKGLPLAGGLGGSAASAVAGALAARLAAEPDIEDERASSGDGAIELIAAALEGEAAVAGRHLDNIAASVLGGLTISRSLDPIDAIAVRLAAPWWVALVTPAVRIETKAARAMLPQEWPRESWVAQMANTAALVHAFASGDGELLARSLDDRYAEPPRARLIPQFHEVKRAALAAGAFGCSISGSGPTLFAICSGEPVARKCCTAMQQAFAPTPSTTFATPVAREGARRA
jgi:homoserine kinase